jgi:hypothetical protein
MPDMATWQCFEVRMVMVLMWHPIEGWLALAASDKN